MYTLLLNSMIFGTYIPLFFTFWRLYLPTSKYSQMMHETQSPIQPLEWTCLVLICGNSIELVEFLFRIMTFIHFTQRTIWKKLAKHLSVLIFTRFEVIINNITMRKYCILLRIPSESEKSQTGHIFTSSLQIQAGII